MTARTFPGVEAENSGTGTIRVFVAEFQVRRT